MCESINIKVYFLPALRWVISSWRIDSSLLAVSSTISMFSCTRSRKFWTASSPIVLSADGSWRKTSADSARMFIMFRLELCGLDRRVMSVVALLSWIDSLAFSRANLQVPSTPASVRFFIVCCCSAMILL